jgi:hypothetical protein
MPSQAPPDSEPGPPPRARRRGTPFRRSQPLGRIYGVLQQSWKLSDDPRRTPAGVQWVLTESTAAEAADLARHLAHQFPSHGFHKPSGSWWGADDGRFHRFRVRIKRPRTPAGALLVAAILGSGYLAWRHRRPGGGSQKRSGDTSRRSPDGNHRGPRSPAGGAHS